MNTTNRTRDGSTRRWRKIRASIERRRLPCALCGRAIDYEATAPDPQSFSVDHIIPVTHAPELQYDRANLQPAHLSCNRQKGTGAEPPMRNSEDW